MAEPLPPPVPSGEPESGIEIRPSRRAKESPMLAVPSPVAWATAAVFTMLSAWLAIKLWSCGHELNALRATSELEHAASRMLRNELDAERLISAHLAEDIRKLEESLKTSTPVTCPIPGTQELNNLRTLRLLPARGIEMPGMAFVVWDTRSHSGLVLVEHLPSPTPGHEYRLGIAEAADVPWQDAGALSVDSSTGIWRIFFVHSAPLAESTRFAIRRSSENGASADAEVILSGP